MLKEEQDYEVVSVEPTDPPGDTVGTGWHCYVIGHGVNRIRGYKRGSVKAVREAAEAIVVRLNERRRGKSGRVNLNMTSHGKAPRRK